MSPGSIGEGTALVDGRRRRSRAENDLDDELGVGGSSVLSVLSDLSGRSGVPAPFPREKRGISAIGK